MGFADKLKKLDAHRLQQSVKATVQSNGRLTFTVDATSRMELSEDKSLIVFEAEGGDLGATISTKGDPDAFVLKKCGLYYYIAFKNYLQQAGIDYKSQRIIYDITELDEELDGRTLYRFERRVLPKNPELLPVSDLSESGEGNADGSGSGRGAGCGAGDGSGYSDDTDDDLPPDEPESTTPEQKARPAPSPRQEPTLPSSESRSLKDSMKLMDHLFRDYNKDKTSFAEKLISSLAHERIDLYAFLYSLTTP